MERVPSAEEFCKTFKPTGKTWQENFHQTMIEFAKLHRRAILDEVVKQANMIGETQHDNGAPDVTSDFVYVVDSNGPDYGYRVNPDSILDAYPEDNIK